jgi:hypothetical protein
MGGSLGAGAKVAFTRLNDLEPSSATPYSETAYDGLGRVISTSTPYSGGFLTTTVDHLSPQTTETTRPRGNATRRTVEPFLAEGATGKRRQSYPRLRCGLTLYRSFGLL